MIPTATLPAGVPSGTKFRVAKVVTEVTAPVVLASTLLIVVALRSAASRSDALLIGVVAAAFAAAIPFAFILRGARRGRWTSHHVDEREHRPLVLSVALGSLTLGLVVLTAWNAPRQLVALLAAMGAGLAAVLVVSRFWKVSIHSAVAGGTTIVLALVFGPALFVFGLLAGAAAWSRIVLDDHSAAQVIVGLVIGAAIAAAIFAPLR